MNPRFKVFTVLTLLSWTGMACNKRDEAIDDGAKGAVQTVARELRGDILSTIALPMAAQCPDNGGGFFGSSLAVVPDENVPGKINLIVSCFNSRQLFRIDPTTNPPALIETINTNISNNEWWGAFSFRPDRGDLLGCAGNNATGGARIMRINIFGMNKGNSVFMFNAVQGASNSASCTAMAWDASDDTVWQEGCCGPELLHHFTEAGVEMAPAFITAHSQVGTMNPEECTVLGLHATGNSLFFSCTDGLGANRFQQRNKNHMGNVDNFNLPSSLVGPAMPQAQMMSAGDIECDQATFASQNKVALWARDMHSNDVRAFELPMGSCGPSKTAPPIVAPGACPGGSLTDTDGDGLLDCWEIAGGIDYDGDGMIDLQLYDDNGDGVVTMNERPDVNRKDLYVEVDWINGHQPNANLAGDVTAVFNAAPVLNPNPANPLPVGDPRRTGVTLHLIIDEQVLGTDTNITAFAGCTAPAGPGQADFDAIKTFGTFGERLAQFNRPRILDAKALIFRYAVFVHDIVAPPNTFSGCAEIGGNDFIVSLGAVPAMGAVPHGGTRDQQAATFVHELGHTLGLGHGGGDLLINCKPNYISIMSYARQFTNFVAGRLIDYSRTALPTLNEAMLNEAVGIGGAAGFCTAFGPPPVLSSNAMNVCIAPSMGPIDWNRMLPNNQMLMTPVDINNFNITGCLASPGETLVGFDDWANLRYSPRGSLDYADGSHTTGVQEQIYADARAASGDADGDTLLNLEDNCPLAANPTQADSDGDQIGDACDACSGTSFAITQNTYDGPQWWGTITFKNTGTQSVSNYRVEFDIPAGSHCTAESTAVPPGATLTPLTGSNPAHTVSNHCIFTWTNATPLAPNASKTFNYSTDTQNFTSASSVVASEWTCTCVPESDAAFCSRLAKNCGAVTGQDNCTLTRTVSSCGSCTAPATCGGGGVANVCGASTTLGPTADAYVKEGQPSTNFGTEQVLLVKNQPGSGNTRKTFLKFDVSGITGTVTSARLRLFGNHTIGTTQAAAYAVTTDSWTETGITWNNRPSPGPKQDGNVTITTTQQYYEFNVTSFVASEVAAGNNTVSLAVLPESDTTNSPDTFNSREAASNQPQLVITQ
jgi:hypothetical protein